MIGALTLLLLCKPALQLNLDFCEEDLGLESGELGDEALTASSSYDPANVGPKNARLHNEGAGGAWCPREPVSREKDQQWIQVNLTAVRIISAVLTQGRFAGGQGQEYAQAYRLHYWRRGLADWKEYRDSLGRTVIPGNVDTYSTAVSPLQPLSRRGSRSTGWHRGRCVEPPWSCWTSPTTGRRTA